MNKFVTAAVFGVLMAALTMMPELALAQTTSTGGAVGSGPLSDIAAQIKGNVGTLVGLGIALLGLWTWLMQQSSWGIVMIIGGVAITAFPGLWEQAQAGFKTAFDTSGASTTSKSVDLKTAQ